MKTIASISLVAALAAVVLVASGCGESIVVSPPSIHLPGFSSGGGWYTGGSGYPGNGHYGGSHGGNSSYGSSGSKPPKYSSVTKSPSGWNPAATLTPVSPVPKPPASKFKPPVKYAKIRPRVYHHRPQIRPMHPKLLKPVFKP